MSYDQHTAYSWYWCVLSTRKQTITLYTKGRQTKVSTRRDVELPVNVVKHIRILLERSPSYGLHNISQLRTKRRGDVEVDFLTQP